MAYSYIKYTSDGSTANYTFAFPYIDSSHIKVLVDGVLTTGFTFSNASAVTLSPVPSPTTVIEIRRETPKDNPPVNFTDGSVLLEADLDLMVLFSTYVAQETWDRSDVVIAKADLVITASAQAKLYAELAYKYERLSNDHKENALDADDRAKAYKELAATFAEATKSAATLIESDKSEVEVNRGYVETALNDVLIAKGLVDAQSLLASAILTSSQAAATEAQTIANAALVTAQAVSDTAAALSASIETVASQQDAALAAAAAAETARVAAVTAKTASETASATATTQANTASTQASNAATSASSASTDAAAATTQASNASTSATAAGTAKTAAEAARDLAEGYASTSDPSLKANLASPTFTGVVGGITASMVGLGNVNNTADTAKPVSTAQGQADADVLSAAAIDATSKANARQAELVSGINLKTLNSVSLLGSTDIVIDVGVTSINGQTGDVTGIATTTDITNERTATATLTNKNLADPLITGATDIDGSVRANIVSVSDLAIDCSAGNYFKKTISATSAFTFESVPALRSYAFTLELTHTSGVITWPTAVKWPENTAPTLTVSRTHVFVFITEDGGTRWRGASLINYVN
jgi:hypothetical protein